MCEIVHFNDFEKLSVFHVDNISRNIDPGGREEGSYGKRVQAHGVKAPATRHRFRVFNDRTDASSLFVCATENMFANDPPFLRTRIVRQ